MADKFWVDKESFEKGIVRQMNIRCKYHYFEGVNGVREGCKKEHSPMESIIKTCNSNYQGYGYGLCKDFFPADTKDCILVEWDSYQLTYREVKGMSLGDLSCCCNDTRSKNGSCQFDCPAYIECQKFKESLKSAEPADMDEILKGDY